ncbi:hypothetical protein CLU79DRAFT_752934 [Phycomyces nitens]|nr:hypothetical protein CLU79DRAFT_752934 [Phycomyces nitens]
MSLLFAKKACLSAKLARPFSVHPSRLVGGYLPRYIHNLPPGFISDPKYDKAVQLTELRGVNITHDPLLSKGTAFSMDERERLSIRGLVPPRQQNMEMQLKRVKRNMAHCETPLSKFIFLNALQDRNETLFYKLIIDNIKEMAGIIYTPTVGLASQKSHSIYRRSRGMYFSAQDRGNMSAMVYNWPHPDVDVIVVTDGSRILGLGDLGANGMQIPVGKLSLYVAAGGIHPRTVLPVVLDVGTNNQELLHDPLYLGLPQPRLQGEEYYAMVDEWVRAVTGRWPHVLIQFEDFKHPHAYNLLNKYRNKITCFNDDIQSTSTITLAGILASLKARGKDQEDLAKERIICVGAGSAGVGVCEGIIDCMVTQGKVKSREEAYESIFMLDQHGLLGNHSIATNDTSNFHQSSQRSEPLDELQLKYVKKNLPDRLDLESLVERVKPTVILGLTGIKGVFTEKSIRTMSRYQERPVIFPLSNPDTHAECTAKEAFEWSDGRAIFASGSPFENVDLKDGKIGHTNQCNNSYSFPGIGLGVTVSKASRVTSTMFLEAAKVIAEMATEDELKQGILFPSVNNLRDVSHKVATRVCEVAYTEGVAKATLKEGELLSELVKDSMYTPEYVPLVHFEHE